MAHLGKGYGPLRSNPCRLFPGNWGTKDSSGKPTVADGEAAVNQSCFVGFTGINGGLMGFKMI